MTPRQARRLLATIKLLSPERRRRVLAGLPPGMVRAIQEEWWWGAHGGQREPRGDWRIWSIVAGRGFGKTRAGAEWVWQRARDVPSARIALVGASAQDVARVMVEGESGLLAIARCGEDARWYPSKGELHFSTGARAFAYSAAQPEQLRGPEHHFAWADELAKWPRAEAAWHNLMLGLRGGARPRALVTTTPRPVPLLKAIKTLDGSVETNGRTDQNRHLPVSFQAAMAATYGDSRLGRQELEGVLFDAPEGALWTHEMLDAGRGRAAAPARVVVGVDPPGSAAGTCGIVVAGADEAGTCWVLADASAAGLSPEGWARRVAAAAAEWGADLVVAEKNQGGEMIGSVLRGVEAALPVRLVAATRSKAERAVPVALRFETGRARLGGWFPALEEQMCAFTQSGWEGEGSPDRADAMVWALTELIRPAAAPRIRCL